MILNSLFHTEIETDHALGAAGPHRGKIIQQCFLAQYPQGGSRRQGQMPASPPIKFSS
jgi:hypothetical protein